MELKLRNNKLALYCSYAYKDVPVAVRGRWDKNLRAWTWIPSRLVVMRLIDEANKIGQKVLVDDEILNTLTPIAKKSGEITEELFKTPPRKHQKSMIEYFLEIDKCFTFSGVGSGKTLAAIYSALIRKSRGEVKKCLVVTPASIMVNFLKEVKKHCHEEATVISGSIETRKQKLQSSLAFFDIINYEMLGKLYPEIAANSYDMVIFDEIHYCKGRDTSRGGKKKIGKDGKPKRSGGTKRSGDSKMIADMCKYRIGLSGTILSNNYEDIFMPFKIIDDTIFGPHWGMYKDRYLRYGGYGGYQIIGTDNEEELKRLIASISIKFDLRDVVDLPPEVIVKKTFTLGDKSRSIYDRLKQELLLGIEEGHEDERMVQNVLEKLLRMRQVSSGFVKDEGAEPKDVGSEKLDLLESIIEQIEGKVAVFCDFTHSIDRVAALCKSRGWSYMVFDGRTKNNAIYEEFNSGPTKVWIAQLKKGIGYSIPSAKHSIFYESNYSRQDHVQCKGRTLRLEGSETGSCYYFYLMAEDTIDEVVDATLEKKDFTAKEALEYVRGIK